MFSCNPQGPLPQRGSLAATVLTEGKTLLEGSADLENLHQANRRGILPSGRGVIFQ